MTTQRTGGGMDLDALERTFAGAPIPSAIVELPSGRFMSVNRAMCERLGYTAEELARLRTKDITHPEDRNIRDSVPLEPQRTIQKRFVTKHGNIVHTRVAFTLLEPAGADHLGCSFVQFIDISNEVSARSTSEQHQQLLHSLFQDAMVPMALTVRRPDPFLDVNEAFCKLLGYTRTELLTMAPQDLGPHGESERAAVRLAEAVAAGKTRITLDRRFETKDGRLVDTILNVAWNEGSPRTYAAQLVDVTELNIERRARLQSEAMFQTVFEASPIGLAVITENGRFGLVNAELAAMLGTSSTQLVGESLIADGGDLASALASGFATVSLTPNSPFRTDVEFSSMEGPRMVDVTMKAVPSADDQVHHVVALVVDVTTSLEARRELERLVASKDEFVASVSHELRTPLSVIVGLASELRSNIEAFTGAERDELVRILSDQADEMANLIEDLLTSGRLNAESLRLSPRAVTFSELIEQILTTSAPMPSSNVTIEVADTPLTADVVRLRQILRNLITNAMRYGGENIWIRTLDEPGEFVAAVEDDGPRIPYDKWQEIFEPYEKASTSSGHPGAVGLGLTVSRRLATTMGGSLEYTHAQGRSRFTLRLPRTGVGAQ